MKLLLISYAFLLAFQLVAEEKPLFDPGGFSLILGGNGTVATKGQPTSVFGANVSLVQTGTLGLPFQLGIRQTYDHQRVEPHGINILSTKLFYDVILLRITKRADVAIGGNAGVTYGDTPALWSAGPEIGVRWWIRPTAAIVGRIDYPFDLNRGRAMNVLNYFIGIQVQLEKPKTK
jgi:hypothetical protein